ncbi:MAG TPA: hypothetical protein PLW35_15750, partial [Verrucomicrobiota bacterium]|nr:hypothetical protein [Verrucomicrobiota bacterium]
MRHAISHRIKTRIHPAPALILFCTLIAPVFLRTSAADLPARARQWKDEVTSKIMPYWYDKTVDWQRGGYVLSDDALRKPQPA